MDNTKLKRVRIIGLIVLTVAVVIAVALTVYFVDKKDKQDTASPRYTTYNIGQLIEGDNAQYTVKDVQFFGSLEGVEAPQGKVLCVVYITVHSGKLSSQELSIDMNAPIVRDFGDRVRSVKTGSDGVAKREEINFKSCADSLSGNSFAVFECGDKGIKYMVCKGARVALGEPYITEA